MTIRVSTLGCLTMPVFFLLGCGSSGIPKLNPVLGPPPDSNQLMVFAPGTPLSSGPKNYVDFSSFTNGTATKDLSYTAADSQTVQVLIYGSSANSACDLESVQTFAEWTPQGGSATRVNTGTVIFAGDSYVLQKGTTYHFRFIANVPASCQYANFTFIVLAPLSHH